MNIFCSQFHFINEEIMNYLIILFIIFSSATAINFQCWFKLTYYRGLPSTYICSVTSWSDVDNKILTAVNGNHHRGRTNLDVKGILFDLRGKNLDYLPMGIEDFFPNLLAYSVFRGVISNYTGNEFFPFKNLELIAIHETPLEFLPGNLFSKNKNLKTIYLMNKVKLVGSGFLDGLNKLEYVMFSEICLNDSASTASEIESLKEKLREHCKDSNEISDTQDPAI